MEYTKTVDGNACKVVMKGKFTFSDHTEFKSLLAMLSDKAVQRIDFDMKGVEFVDSAALGLLLLARDEATTKSKTVTITSPHGQVKKMFQISRFYELFNITD